MKVISNLLLLACKIINHLIPKKLKYVYFIPHDNCSTDKYDIINYRSDNVLSLFNYMLRDNRFDDYRFNIEITELEKTGDYSEYCKRINPKIAVNFLRNKKKSHYNKNNILYLLKAYYFIFRSSYIFTSSWYYNFIFKTKKQKIICLGYGAPFKYHYHDAKKFKNMRRIKDVSFDFHVSTSDLASRIESVDSGISYYKFLNLGYPRNDNLFNVQNIIYAKDELKKILGYDFKKMILYTPTFRDYEKDETETRNIFGYFADYNILSDVLVENECVLIGKLHPWQNTKIIEKENLKNMHIFSPTDKLGLYDLMAISDALITDYTSGYCDYLLLDRPVIFNFYDLETYKRERGFAFDPIEAVCAGEIVYSFDNLIKSISKILNGFDSFNDKRRLVNSLFNKYSDSNSSKRICDEFFSVK
ncbi:teichoic acid biosynthesis protein B [Spirochaetia bacterium]|nr:teichoic acid biosynthesis protein B [Spirochaetia bacterium]